MEPDHKDLSGLAKQLVQQGLVDAATLADVAAEARAQGASVIAQLVQRRCVAASTVASCAMSSFHLPLVDLNACVLDAMQDASFDGASLLPHNLLPLRRRGGQLFVALADPADLPTGSPFKRPPGVRLRPVLVEADKLSAAIDQARQSIPALGLDVSLDAIESDIPAVEPEVAKDDGAIGSSLANEAPIVRFVNQVLVDAVNSNASDIHFEPFEASYRIRFRVDGVLSEAAKPPKRLGRRLAARLKVMADLDVAERRVPQDGRFRITLPPSRSLDLRINTLPTLWGEKVVLRILDPASTRQGVDALGFDEGQKALFLEALARPDGMILVTGPTGSGKTLTLYTGLRLLNNPQRNIATAEDPVEINLEGINQVNVNPKVGLGFATALRAFLRQDPDVLMVGEIRDLETAEIAVKAAQTGHLVLSTLHTNSAAETLTRLRNIGVPAFNLATSVALIIAQRLLRRLCPSCKTAFDAPVPALIREGYPPQVVAAGMRLFQPNAQGCPSCRNGYKGRVGVYEAVRITRALAEIIMADGDALSLARQARQHGFPSLRAACLAKVAAGETSLTEANRVTHAEGSEGAYGDAGGDFSAAACAQGADGTLDGPVGRPPMWRPDGTHGGPAAGSTIVTHAEEA